MEGRAGAYYKKLPKSPWSSPTFSDFGDPGALPPDPEILIMIFMSLALKLTIFSKLFAGVAEEMGTVLGQSAFSPKLGGVGGGL